MRKTRIHLLVVVAICMTMTACFKDEPLNAECDIVRAWIHYDAPGDYTWNLSDTIINTISSAESKITFRVKPGTDKTRLAPQFLTTDGATLEPASGTELDFSSGAQTYRVTSQDGNWHRDYVVEVVELRRTESDTIHFDFENPVPVLYANNKLNYYRWVDLNEDGTEAFSWASGNGGFAIANMSAAPEAYPTVPLDEGYEGKGVKLTTRDTGPFGKMAGMPLAAGNLFIGNFVIETALKDALKSTQFGTPFDKKPVKFTGYYKYFPGDGYKDQNGNDDEGAIYAIFFKNHDAAGQDFMLDGSNVQTSEMIVAKAIMPEVKLTEEWTKFEIPFDYSGLAFDQETLETFGYSLTVVFSSSTGGARFQGAIGSTLYIDKVEIICETDMTE